MRTDSEEVIGRLIIHSLLEDLNEQESRALENWLKTPEHQDFYKKSVDGSMSGVRWLDWSCPIRKKPVNV